MKFLCILIVIALLGCAVVSALGKDKAVCQLPKDNGPCRARLQNYYYNSESKKCEKFEFGGCEGNANRFRKQKDCEELCLEKPL